MKTIVLFSLIIFISVESFSQIRIFTELRFRPEFRYGYKLLPADSLTPAFVISQRSRLGVAADKEKFSLMIIIQDARVWGDESVFNSTGVNGDPASMDLKEAWLSVKPSELFSIRIGRQEWVYDDERLLSKRDWGNTGVQYDGILLKYNKPDFIADLGFSWNNREEYLFGQDYRYFQTVYYFDTISHSVKSFQKEINGKIKSLNFIYLMKKFRNNLKLSFLGLTSLWQEPGTSDIFHVKYTFGPNLLFSLKNNAFSGQLFYQTGKDMKGKEVNAYFCGIGYTLSLKKIRLITGLDILSGEKRDSAKWQTLFDLHYGNRHKFYGNLDYFSQLDKATFNGGLNDIYLKFNYKFINELELGIDYHYFLLNQSVKNPAFPATGSVYLKRFLGHETDVYFNIKMMKEMSLKGGLSLLLPSESLEIIQGVSGYKRQISKWIWLMLTFNTDIFKSE